MRKIKVFLTLFLCAACVVPSIHADAVVINREPISEEDDREETSNVDTDIREDITVVPDDPEIVNAVEPADIVFAVDSTGSMAPHIQNVADNIEAFSKYLEEKTVEHMEGQEIKVKPRMAVVEYKDITYDGKDSTVVHTVGGSPWHTSTEEMVKTLQDVKANIKDGDGGDNPETLLDALGYVVDGKTFNLGGTAHEGQKAHKFVIVLSDAEYKVENNFGYTESSMYEELKAQDINVSVITKPYHYDIYKNIVDEKDGKEHFFDINSPTFSKELEKLANEIFTTIVEERSHEIKTIKVTCTGDNTIKVGNTAELKAVILPETVTDKKVTWSVSDEEVASIEVSEDTLTCKVTGLKEGTAKVEATTEDGAFTGSYEITVFDSEGPSVAIEISKGDIKVTPSKKTIAKKKSFNIKVALKKEFTEDKEEEEIDDIWESNVDNIAYRSSKGSIASVNDNGKVTGKKKGRAIIKTIITLADGNEFIYKTTVNVK